MTLSGGGTTDLGGKRCLIEQRASVTLVDSMMPECGGNRSDVSDSSVG